MGIQPHGKDTAIVTHEGLRDSRSSLWDSVRSFHNAPCMKQTVGTGFLGGLSIGGLRYWTHRSVGTASTWGAVVGGLLAGTNWYVCRRAMYNAAFEEAALLQRVMAKDPEALREYSVKLQARGQRYGEQLENGSE
jgi:hypothetical protein